MTDSPPDVQPFDEYALGQWWLNELKTINQFDVPSKDAVRAAWVAENFAKVAFKEVARLRAELVATRAAGEVVTGGNEILQRRCDEYAKDAEAMQGIRKLMGHVQNATDTTVKLFQDDATYSYHVTLGNKSLAPSYWGSTLGEAIAMAVKNTPDD